MIGEYYPPWWQGLWPFNTPITVGQPYVPNWTPPSPLVFPQLLILGSNVTLQPVLLIDEDRNDEFPECYP